MKTSPHIVRTKPYLVPKVWGGRRLSTRFGKELTDDRPYGEAWEIADLDEGQSLVDSGPLAGLPLRALSQGWRRALVGEKAVRPDRFPLLVKLLDAGKDLSVQVHPGPEAAARIEGAHSKEETWLILDVEDDAAIIHGLSENGVSAADFRQAVADGVVEELLQRVPVKQGDLIHVEPGTIHSIGAGVALLEIQEPSDTTYRVYDYERPGLDGTPRELHLDAALQVARLGRSDSIIERPKAPTGRVDVLAAIPAYRVERLRVGSAQSRVAWQVDPDSAQVLHLLQGEVVIEDGIGGEVVLKAFESAVVPALIGSLKMEVRSACEVVVAGLAVEQLVRNLRVSGPVSVFTS